MSTSVIPAGPLGNVLRRLSETSAALGGVILVGIALLTLASVLGRSVLSNPIQGDVEIVQLACAVARRAPLPSPTGPVTRFLAIRDSGFVIIPPAMRSGLKILVKVSC